MCVYNGRRVSLQEFIRLKQMEKALRGMAKSDVPVQEGYTYRDWPILKPIKDKSDFEIVMAHWEFLPPVIASGEAHLGFRERYDTLNAKGETLLTSPLFGNAVRHGRCLVLSSHFFEYRHLEQTGKSGTVLKQKRKIPYVVTLPGHDYFFMAGVSQTTVDTESGEVGETFAIVTTEANKLMAQVHNSKGRMPTILPEDLAADWLLAELPDNRIVEIATYQYPAVKMAARPVRKDFRAAEDPTESFIHENVPDLVL